MNIALHGCGVSLISDSETPRLAGSDGARILDQEEEEEEDYNSIRTCDIRSECIIFYFILTLLNFIFGPVNRRE